MSKKVLLYSGGLDSWLIDKLWKPDVKLYVDMNTEYSKQEISNLPEDVIIEKLDLGRWERPDAIIPLRNLYLAMIATNYGDEILMGVTKGDRVLDKSYEFANKASDLLSYLFSSQWWNPVARNIKINIESKQYTKEDLLKMYVDQGGSLETAWKDTFSCYHPVDSKPCMQCKPCFRKFTAFAQLGYVDKSWLPIVIPYIGKEIVPQITAGTYGRGEKEEAAIMEVYNEYKQFDVR